MISNFFTAEGLTEGIDNYQYFYNYFCLYFQYRKIAKRKIRFHDLIDYA